MRQGVGSVGPRVSTSVPRLDPTGGAASILRFEGDECYWFTTG